jgi:hypothetical protein
VLLVREAYPPESVWDNAFNTSGAFGIFLTQIQAAASVKPMHFQGFIAITKAARKRLKASSLKKFKKIFVVAESILNRGSVCKQIRQFRQLVDLGFPQASIPQRVTC